MNRLSYGRVQNAAKRRLGRLRFERVKVGGSSHAYDAPNYRSRDVDVRQPFWIKRKHERIICPSRMANQSKAPAIGSIFGCVKVKPSNGCCAVLQHIGKAPLWQKPVADQRRCITVFAQRARYETVFFRRSTLPATPMDKYHKWPPKRGGTALRHPNFQPLSRILSISVADRELDCLRPGENRINCIERLSRTVSDSPLPKPDTDN